MINKFRFKLIAISILLLGAGLRFYELGRSLGGGDENAMLLYFGYQPFSYIVTQYFEASNHIFHTVVLHLMVLIFGEDNELAIRFPNFLFGIASLWLIYKTAFYIFKKKEIALTALLISSVCPIHIYYSQTARGYSFIVFFSIAAIYCCIKILETENLKKWALGLTLSGFLSIYTIPTNSYFVFALAGWILSIFLVPNLRKEFQILEKRLKKVRIVFASSFIAIGILVILVYWPLMDQILEVSKYDVNYSKRSYGAGDNAILLAVSSIKNIFTLIFEGPIKYFIPLILVGAVASTNVKKSYLTLLFAILFFPLLIVYFSGVSAYPRNYLYNFPILIIFMAAGLIVAGKWLSNVWNISNDLKLTTIFINQKYLMWSLVVLYVLFSFKWLFSDYYPGLKNENQGTLSEKKINGDHIGINDLLIIPDPRQYLYSRSLYKENLKNIIDQNVLKGVKMIAPKNYSLNNFQIKTESKVWKIFDRQIVESKFKRVHLNKEKDLIHMTNNKSLTVFSREFETQANWRIISGKGKTSIVDIGNDPKNKALSLKADLDEDLVIQAIDPINLDVHQSGLLILIWTMKRSNPQIPVFYPALSFQLGSGPNKATLKLPFGKINEGMNILIPENPIGVFSDVWSANAIMGKIPPGKYKFHLWLKCHSKNSVLYDNFRLFLIPSPIDLSKGFGGP